MRIKKVATNIKNQDYFEKSSKEEKLEMIIARYIHKSAEKNFCSELGSDLFNAPEEGLEITVGGHLSEKSILSAFTVNADFKGISYSLGYSVICNVTHVFEISSIIKGAVPQHIVDKVINYVSHYCKDIPNEDISFEDYLSIK